MSINSSRDRQQSFDQAFTSLRATEQTFLGDMQHTERDLDADPQNPAASSLGRPELHEDSQICKPHPSISPANCQAETRELHSGVQFRARHSLQTHSHAPVSALCRVGSLSTPSDVRSRTSLRAAPIMGNDSNREQQERLDQAFGHLRETEAAYRSELVNVEQEFQNAPHNPDTLRRYAGSVSAYVHRVLLDGVCSMYAKDFGRLLDLKTLDSIQNFVHDLFQRWPDERTRIVDGWVDFYRGAQFREWEAKESTGDTSVPQRYEGFISHHSRTVKPWVRTHKDAVEQRVRHRVPRARVFMDSDLAVSSDNHVEMLGAALWSPTVSVFLNPEYFTSKWRVLEWLLARSSRKANKCHLSVIVPAATAEWEARFGSNDEHEGFLLKLPWKAGVTMVLAHSYEDKKFHEDSVIPTVGAIVEDFEKQTYATLSNVFKKCYQDYSMLMFDPEGDDSPLNGLNLAQSFIQLTLEEQKRGPAMHSPENQGGQRLLLDDLFADGRRFVYVEGVAGAGKTTITKYVALMWATGKGFTQFDLVVRIQLKELNYLVKSDSHSVLDAILEQFLDEHQRNEFRRLQYTDRKILWVFDSLDEAEVEKSKGFGAILRKLCVPELHWIRYAIVTSRAQKMTPIGQAYSVVRVEGFDKAATDAYFEKYFREAELRAKARSLYNTNEDVQRLLQTPLILQLVCFGIKRGAILDQRATLYSLYHDILCCYIPNYCRSRLLLEAEECGAIQEAWLLAMEELALLQDGRFDKPQVAQRAQFERIKHLGIITRTDGVRAEEIFEFGHESFREFFYAQGVANRGWAQVLSCLKNRGRLGFGEFGSLTWYFLSESLADRKALLAQVAAWLIEEYPYGVLHGLAACGAISLLRAVCSHLGVELENRLVQLQPYETPLMAAVWGGRFECVEFLASDPKCTHKIDAKDSDGGTALIWAARKGDGALVAVLLDHGADIDCIDRSGRSALYFAACEGREDCARALLHRGAKDVNGGLVGAAVGGFLQLLEPMVDSGADVDSSDQYGVSALHLAASHGHFDCERALQRRGAGS